ncbi:hypothetical protein [Sansalvadorimonas verongulae]|uniref:hypothetical protein n=1 Tax=Sansalvadorimonas verongulae TaxID=2172824 RepID=UPI0012BB6723|nr:hypothetical protein [Sansalvadorimonas verongulae]MTI12907.1 hypothetical protein [Sansalvadorimonas verongulae]
MEHTRRRRRRSRSKSASRGKKTFNLRRLPVLLLLPVLGWLIVTSLQNLKASAVNSQTQQYMTFWREELRQSKGQYTLPEKMVKVARKGAERAIALAPNKPEYRVAQAQVEDWVVQDAQRHGKVLDAGDKAFQQQGIQAYREAIKMRPAWPYTWADLAMAKARANEIDQEFFNALERATTLGPWEQPVMNTVTQLGLWYGDWLPATVKTAVDENLVRYAGKYPRQAMTVARAQKKTDVVCPLVPKPEWFRRDCSS